MSGYLVIHFVDSPSISLQIGEPTVKRFFAAIELLEEAYSRLDGFADAETIY